MKKLIISLLVSFIPLISFAQGTLHDPRIMKGLDASKLPVLKSFKDLKARPGGLAASAVEIGKVEMIWNNAGTSQTVAPDLNKILPQDFSLWRILRSDNGTVNWMWRASTTSHRETVQSIKSPDGLQVLADMKIALHISDPKSEFYQMSATTDELGFKHFRYGQQYQGIPVWNRDLYVHLNGSGEAYTINGTYEPTPKNITTTAHISNPYSIILTIADLKAQGRWAPVGTDVAAALGFSEPSAKLVLYPDHSKLRLAYEVSIVPNLFESYYYIIDALNGEVITKIQRSCSLVPNDPKSPPVTISHFAGAPNNTPAQPLSGFTNASGTDLNGATQQLRTYQHTDGNYYAIWDLPSFNLAASTLPDQPSGGAMTLSLKNQDYTQNSSIFHNISSDNSWSDPGLVSAHHNMLVTYNYYSNTFSRKAIDDKNGAIVSIIHVTQNGHGMDNAFWNGSGKVMIYGDGDTKFKPLAGGIDVAGHEMTHGVINNTADLIYQFQSGALNESLADVFGVMVDTRNLTIGEDVMQPGQGTCLRDMADPHNTAGGSHQPAHMNEFKDLTADQDNGGVHVNSGIPNKACALLINQLGRDKVQKMYYRALTNYLTRNSQFTDCRIAVQSAAKDLFGTGSTEFNAVGPAFDAVGITGPATDPNKDDIPNQTGGAEYIAFTNVNGDVGLFNPANNKFVIPGTSNLTARVSDNGNSRAQLTAPRSGRAIYFVGPTKKLFLWEVATGVLKIFPDLHIQSDGDLWNAAVSPDESAIALTSAYDSDPNIYITTDGKTVSIQPLAPENTDAGTLKTIDYPDVVSWSPNKSEPKIGFDAFLSNKIGTGSISYWSMYELDYNSKKTYDLFPAQTSDINIGNIAYSNTSPNIITFNSIVNGNDWDVLYADFKNNNIGSLGVDKRTINGNPILDAQKPSFSPNDQALVFASPSNNSLLFFPLSTQNLTFLQFPAAVYQPYWFLVGGSAGVHDAPAKAETHLSVNSSAIYGSGTVTFSLSTSEEITLDIVNLFGQTVHSISKERMISGNHEIKFRAYELASGTYFIRLLTRDGQEMVKFVIEK